MFEQLRQSLNELLERATKPEDRRDVIARMKTTLVQVKLGVDALRDALGQARAKLAAEERELLIVTRRKELAAGIQDTETVSIAQRFERQHQERIEVMQKKVDVQARELELAERELDDMKDEFRKAMSGVQSPSAAPPEDPLAETLHVREEIDALARERLRTERDTEAQRRLEELKRRMGK